MPEVAAAVALPWGDAAPVQTAVALPWGDAGYVQTVGTPFTPIAPPPGATETGDGGLAAPLAIAEATRYDVTHTMTMVLDSTGAVLPVDAVTLSLDDGSVHWTLAGSGGPELFPLFTGGAVVPGVTLTIDGLVWKFLVESVNRPRQFASDRVSFSGRSLAAGAAAPYELERNWIGDAPSSAAQIADGAQQLTGLALDWLAEDWFVPAGVLSFTGTPLGVVLHVAQAAGLVVTAHRSDLRVSVAPRYPILPDQWLCVPPDVQVHFNAVETESYERADQPRYDAVLVTGQQQGAFGVVRAAGTSGNRQAPMVTDVLLTDEPALRQRGQSVLGASGPQARVQRTLPVLTGAGQPGVIERGALVRFVDPGEVWAGVVRSVSVRASLPVVTQTITVERHTATVADAPAPPPLVFNGPIPDISVLVGAAVDIDLSGYWSGGAPPYGFTLRAGALPPGMALTAAGRIVGPATSAAVEAGVRVRAQDEVANMADSNSFEVRATAPSELSVFLALTPEPGGAATGPAATARAAFEALLDPGSIVRDGFGSYSTGEKFTLDTLGGTALLTPNYEIPDPEDRFPVVIVDAVGDPPTFGRFDTTGGAAPHQWMRTVVSWSLVFDTPQAAFGMYMTDVGDFLGEAIVRVIRVDDEVLSYPLADLVVPDGSPSNGWLVFFGIVHSSDLYKEVRFDLVQESFDPGEWDNVGFDDFITGAP